MGRLEKGEGMPKLYRKRFIPDEIVELRDDRIVYHEGNIMITEWDVLHPKAKFSQGVSCYFLEDGYKVSKFLNDQEELVYYYCDIIDTTYNAQENSYLFTDLLADVIVYDSGFVKVVDLAELADMLDEGVITEELVKKCLRRLEKLLEIIYGGNFDELTKYLEIEGSK